MAKNISKPLLLMILSYAVADAKQNHKNSEEPQKSGMKNFMQEIHERFEEMNQQVRQMFNQGQQRFDRALDAFKDDKEQHELVIKSMSPLIDLDEDKNVVRVVIKNVEADSFDASRQGKSLVIATPHAEIIIAIKGSLLTVETIQEVKKEIDREGYSSRTESSSSSSVSRSLRAGIDFDKSDIVFNQKDKELVVEVPFIKSGSEKSQSIPVVIK